MKKFYSFLAAALAVTLSASAAMPEAKVSLQQRVQRLDAQTVAFNVNEAMRKAPSRITLDEGAEEWKSVGTGTYTDGFVSTLFNLDVTTWEVEIEESTTTPGYYRMVNPYAILLNEGVVANDVYIHAENPERVYIETQSLGINFGYGSTYVSSLAGYYMENGDTEDQVAEEGLFGTLSEGVLTFPTKSLLIAMANYNGGNFYYANQAGEFRLLFPGCKDYSLSLTAKVCADDNKVPFMFETGKDVAKALFFCTKGAYEDDAALFDVVAQLPGAQPISAGSYNVNITGEGRYTLFIVALDADGKVKAGKTAPLFGLFENADKWKAIGDAEYTENIIASQYRDFTTVTYKVPAEESLETPGLYRLVNPYGTAWPQYDERFGHTSHKHYIYVDASNPERVLIHEYPIGLDMGYGDAIVESFANYQINLGVDPELPALQEYYGKNDEGNITFPVKGLLFSETGYNNNQKAYAEGDAESSSFAIKLPTTGVGSIESAESAAPAEYFNLQGVKVAKPEAGQLYIVRQGQKVQKVIVK